jgi:hypothetical protein
MDSEAFDGRGAALLVTGYKAGENDRIAAFG